MTGPYENRREPELHDQLLGLRGVLRTGRVHFWNTHSTCRTPEPRALCCNAALRMRL